MQHLKRVALLLKLDLQRLILILIILCVSCLFISSIFILNYLIKAQLIESSLSVNQKYASKVALSTDQYFENMLQELKYSAAIIGQDFEDKKLLRSEVHRLKYQSNNFNSVTVIDSAAQMQCFEPKTLKLSTTTPYTTLGITESLRLKKTYISPPYQATSKNLLVLMSQPVFSPDRHYLGMITGSIYLHKKNVISEILSTSYSYKKSYMYVIDQKNRIIYHPDKKRIGETIKNNNGLDFMLLQKQGNVQLTNSQGIKNLAGFAYIPSVNWIVVAQQPTEELFEQANAIIFKAAVGIFVFYLMMFLVIWRIARYISSPLHGLAQMAGMLTKPEIEQQIQAIDPWYFEVMRFRTALLFSSKRFKDKISELNLHINTDPLTGLHNRRGMQLFLEELQTMRTEFAVLLIDIDLFKRVNDTYGHDQGDAVLKNLAGHMKSNFRDNDICCRMGGEEFAVLMSTADRDAVFNAAERLRKTVEQSPTNGLPPVTISIGIAFWPHDSEHIKEVFKHADNRLYQAKNEGRNCIR
ncbi:MAG: diguanylate cyclase [Acinetobacter sp.]